MPIVAAVLSARAEAKRARSNAVAPTEHDDRPLMNQVS
jgi:hypothetical protein